MTKAERALIEINEILLKYDLDLAACENGLEISDGYDKLEADDLTDERRHGENLRRFRTAWTLRHRNKPQSLIYVCDALVNVLMDRKLLFRAHRLSRRVRAELDRMRQAQANDETLRLKSRETLKRCNPKLYEELFGKGFIMQPATPAAPTPKGDWHADDESAGHGGYDWKKTP
jgi:hypothetical protein